MLGYKDAYNEHKNALKEFEQIRKLHDQQDAAVMMFIYSVVAVGFAGGLVGGLLAPWVRNAGTSLFQTAIRSSVQEMAKSATKEATGGIIKRLQDVSKAAPTGNPYEPVTPDKFDVYLEKKKELDECFARFDKMVDDLQQQAAAEDWPIDVGWLLFNGSRASVLSSEISRTRITCLIAKQSRKLHSYACGFSGQRNEIGTGGTSSIKR